MLKEIINIIEEGLKMPFYFLWNPSKRIYIGYIMTSIVLAFYVYKKSKRTQSFITYLLPKKIWNSASAKTDYISIFFNAFIKIIFIGPYLILGLYLAFYTNEFLMRQFGIPDFNFSATNLVIAYTITLLIFNDFTSYVVHYVQHKIPLLWEFHKTHHSATELNPLTQYRLHPIELIINNARGLLVFGLVAGVFDYLSVDNIDKLTFLGVNIFSFAFLVLGANLRHSHIKLTYFSKLEYLLISPFQHQIHHSNNPKHFDKNMGSKLAIWDWVFGTLVRSKEVGEIQFGLGLNQDKDYTTFWQNLYKPFAYIYKKTSYFFKLFIPQ